MTEHLITEKCWACQGTGQEARYESNDPVRQCHVCDGMGLVQRPSTATEELSNALAGVGHEIVIALMKTGEATLKLGVRIAHALNPRRTDI